MRISKVVLDWWRGWVGGSKPDPKTKAQFAPKGASWICPSCGRCGKDRFELGDTSCVTSAELVWESSIHKTPEGVLKATSFYAPFDKL